MRFHSLRIGDRSRNYIIAAGPFAKIDGSAALAAERKLGIVARNQLPARRTAQRTRFGLPRHAFIVDAARTSRMISAMHDAAAFVLAGGKSSRMGRDKSALILGDKTLLERAVEIARAANEQICIVGGEQVSDAAAWLGCLRISDVFSGQGPLAGIHAALESRHARDLNFVIAVDTPFVTQALVRFLVERAADSKALATLPEAGGRLHPLCGIYRQQFVARAHEALVKRRNKIENAIDSVGLQIISEYELVRGGFDPGQLANLNTPAEFAAAEASLL